MRAITDPRLFMYIITVLFALSAIRHSLDCNWWQVGYALGAVMLNMSVLNMGGK